jgi:hypothetical protein
VGISVLLRYLPRERSVRLENPYDPDVFACLRGTQQKSFHVPVNQASHRNSQRLFGLRREKAGKNKDNQKANETMHKFQ